MISEGTGKQSPQLLPRDAAEALLQSHLFDVEAAIIVSHGPDYFKVLRSTCKAAAAAFRSSPREALDAAGPLG